MILCGPALLVNFRGEQNRLAFGQLFYPKGFAIPTFFPSSKGQIAVAGK